MSNGKFREVKLFSDKKKVLSTDNFIDKNVFVITIFGGKASRETNENLR